jgi:hypothetical protein
MWRRRRWASGFSLNKGPFFFLWRLPVLVLCRSTGRSWTSSSAKPPRWWSDEGIEAGMVFFNKRWLPWCCSCAQWRSSSLTGHGGAEGGRRLLATCGGGGGRGNLEDELIHGDGTIAIAIYCRNGGEISTFGAEALSRSGHGSSKPSLHEVMRSPWRLGRP